MIKTQRHSPTYPDVVGSCGGFPSTESCTATANEKTAAHEAPLPYSVVLDAAAHLRRFTTVDKRIIGGNEQGAIGHALTGYDCGEPGVRGKEIRTLQLRECGDRGSESLKECMNVVLEVDRMLSHFEEPPPTQSERRIRGAMTKAAWVMRERAGVPSGTWCRSVKFRALRQWAGRHGHVRIKNIVRKKRTQGKQCKEREGNKEQKYWKECVLGEI
ncbi:hypothetical protein B0H14DRAFT_2612959 [Mycena olivaceomarginata]|nr:hypothetical protein B0H14DRAFT_2612959 [Mycena olivaceomarginata]